MFVTIRDLVRGVRPTAVAIFIAVVLWKVKSFTRNYLV